MEPTPHTAIPPALARHAARLWRGSGEKVAIEVQGDSMRPLIRPGERVVLQFVDPQELRPGDLMVYLVKAQMVAHRVLKRRWRNGCRQFCEKGDNAAGWRWVDEERVWGKVSALKSAWGELPMDRWPQRPANRLIGGLGAVQVTLSQWGAAVKRESRAANPWRVLFAAGRLVNRLIHGFEQRIANRLRPGD